LISWVGELEIYYPGTVLILHQDEMPQLFAEMTKLGHKGDRAFLNHAFDGKPYSYKSKISKPSATIATWRPSSTKTRLKKSLAQFVRPGSGPKPGTVNGKDPSR
jgi:hypothetical protein